jgi:hypothetical protein
MSTDTNTKTTGATNEADQNIDKQKGITSILNTHYNNNIGNFEPNINSENLKTVMLKIGEVSSVEIETIESYYADLPRYKKCRLSGIKKRLTTKQKYNLITTKTTSEDYPEYDSNLNTQKSHILWENYKKLTSQQKGNLLDKIHKPVQEEYSEVPTNLVDLQCNLKKLDDYFENYGKCRRFILKHVYESWCDQNGEYCKSSSDIYESINKANTGSDDKPISEVTYKKLQDIEKIENEEKLSIEQIQEITNAFHQWVKQFCKNKIINDKIKELKMDRLLPNIYEDISSGLVGFWRKLIKAEIQYEKELPNLNTFVTKLNTFNPIVESCPYTDWDNSNRYGKIIDGYLNQSYLMASNQVRKEGKFLTQSKYQTKNNPKVNIYLEFLQAIENAENLKTETINGLLKFNNVYNELRTTCELIKHHTAWQQKEFELMFKKKDKVTTIIEHKAVKDGLFTIINPIFFDPKKSFPQFEEQNTIQSLVKKIDELQEKISKYESNTELSIIEISKKKIFKESFLSIKNKEKNAKGKLVPKQGVAQELFEKEENTPNGFAHKVFDYYYRLAKDGEIEKDNRGKKVYNNGKPSIIKEDPIDCYCWATEEIIKKAESEKKAIFAKINNGSIKENYTLLRYLAGWIWVQLRILIEEIIDYSVREGLIREISQLASTISGFAYNLERNGYENQSIYLSDFLTPPTDKSSEHDFKSSSYLCYDKSDEKNKELRLALSFIKPILQDNNSSQKALVYTFDSKNDKDKKYENSWKKDRKMDLKYFDYNYWNKVEPLAYKSFTKPDISIGVGESEFNFPLHFGVNQSRKYFWNTVRGTKDNQGNLPKDKDEKEIINNQIHHIFNPNSRLKVSSMRLIKKHNPIRKVWEYYLSLAIYRLEEPKQECLPKTQKNEIIGVDIGENTLLALGKISSQGSELKSNFIVLKHIHNYKTSASNLIYESKEILSKENYLSPETRLKLKNKSSAIRNQSNGFVTKSVLSGYIIAIEGKYLSVTKSEYDIEDKIHNQIVKKLAVDFPKKASQKLSQEISSQCIFGGKIIPMETELAKNNSNSNDFFSNTITNLTSQVCSNCGSVSSKLYDMNKVIKNLSNDNELNLLDCINENTSINHPAKSDERKIEYSNLYSFSFVQSELPAKEKSKEYRDAFSLNKYKQEVLEHLGNDTKLKENLNPKKKELSPLHWRPKWFYGHIDYFRCFSCGFHCECDDQASLNIARFKLFNNLVYDENGNYCKTKMKSEFEGIKNELKNNSIEKDIDSYIKNIDQKKEEDCRIYWYQVQLLKHGYDENGNSNWNLPPKDKEDNQVKTEQKK